MSCPQKAKSLGIAAALLAAFFLNMSSVHGAQATAEAANGAASVRLGNLELRFQPYKKGDPRTGIICLYDGDPVSIGSGFGVTSLDWKQSCLGFGNPAQYDVSTEDDGQSKGIVINLHGEGGQGHVRYTIKPGNVLEIEFKVKLAGKGGRVNFDVFKLEPAAFQGLPFAAELENGRSEELRFAPFRETEERLILLRDFQELSLDSRLGEIGIVKLPGSNLSVQVADWRGKKWPPRPYLYLGVSGTVSKAGSENVLGLRVEFPRTPFKSSGIEKFVGKDKWKPGSVVSPVLNERPLLYPTPKKVQWLEGRCKLSPQTSLVFKNVPREDQAKLSDTLQRVVSRKYGFDLDSTSKEMGTGSRIGLSLFEKHVGESPEYYELSVHPDKIVIRANRAIGLQYGIRTLEELLWADPNDPSAICAKISDWPSLSRRGVHCFTGKDSAGLHEKFIERIFSPAKFNNIVYECGYVKWDTTPLAHFDKYGMEKVDAAQVIADMRSNYLEPIPLLQSMGHTDWLNRNVVDESIGGRAYGEYLVSPTTYVSCFDPTNKKSVEFLEKVYDEVIELFKPKQFHVGFDECFGGPAQLEALSERVGVPPEKLFVEQLLHFHDYLAKRNIQTIMWGDILLKRGDECPDYGHAPSLEAARTMREEIPKDVIVADWHYGNFKPDEYINIGVLQKAGFEVLGSPAYFPGNLIWFNAALKKAGALGYLHTTWAGFNFDKKGFDQYFTQYYSYILGAEVAWDGDYERVEDVPFSFDRKFVELWTKDDFSGFMRSGTKSWFMDLSGVANLKLDDGDWLGMTPENALGEVDALASSNVEFAMTTDGKIRKAVLFDAKYNPGGSWPEKLVVEVGRKLDALVFVQAASLKGEWDEEIASYVITYADGSKYAVPLKYGRNIFWYADTRNNRIWDNHNSPLVWQSRNRVGQPVAIRYLKVDNPHPQKVIKSLVVKSADKKPGLILFGIAGFAR